MAGLSQHSVAQLIRVFEKLGCYDDQSYTGIHTPPITATDLKRDLFAWNFDRQFLERCAPQNIWNFDRIFPVLYDGSFFNPPPAGRNWPAIRDRLEYLSDPLKQDEQKDNGHKLLLRFAEYVFHKRQTLSDHEGWYAAVDELLMSLETDGFSLSEGHIVPTTASSKKKEIVSLTPKEIQKPTSKDPTRIWVIHGRDERLRNGLFQFLRSIGLQPLEFLEARKLTQHPSPYVGEILEAAFEHAQAVVVLLTPDDEGRLHPAFQSDRDSDDDKRLTGQARLNVIFEAGMAFVTHPKQTVLVQIGEVRPFSDVHGRHIVHLDNSTQRRQELASRLEDAGCPVKLSGTDWHTTGDLTPPAAVGISDSKHEDVATLRLYKTRLKGFADLIAAADIVADIHTFFASHPLYLTDFNSAFLEKYPLDFREQLTYNTTAAMAKWSLDELKRDVEQLAI